MRDRGDGRVACTFYQSEADHGRDGRGQRPAATLEIDPGPPTVPDPEMETFSIDAFAAQAHAVIDADRFYRKLRDNGNQYGPAFQNVRAIWQAGDQALGRLSVARGDVPIGSGAVPPTLLDAATQLLAPFIMEKGNTFLFRSIDRLDVTNADVPESLWGHAVLHDESGQDGTSLVGSVRVFDRAGRPYLTLAGIAFAVVDGDDAAAGARSPILAIAANFTAEPIEDSLRFWAITSTSRCTSSSRRSLRSSSSCWTRKACSAGTTINVILLALEEWASERHCDMTISLERAARCFGDWPRYRLPNNLEIVHLNRYSGAEEIVVGTPVAARSPGELAPLIGNLLNMVPVRCDVAGDPTFAELLRRTRDTTLDAFSNSDLPFEAMMKHLTVERVPSRNPIFQVMLQVLSTAPATIGDLHVSSFHFDLKFAQFDLSLHLYEDDSGYLGRFEYCTDVYHAATVKQVSSHFEELLHAVVGDPGQRISEIMLLTPSERERIIHAGNGSRAVVPMDTLVHDLFEAQAERTPERTALRVSATTLSYAGLEARANRLAWALRARGVRRGQRVGVCVERDTDMVVAVLAVLKAGAAYVPLDQIPPVTLRAASSCSCPAERGRAPATSRCGGAR